ncbi:M23 family metallopeptidase [Bacteroidales bacterium OttesenSCG-928-B11]|nr:M23 family metallopeptidase [Bacteroidales bacterium OttesenSCG-928-E04]MDL2309248.1 M23 family metallopeptidase [Bacteroidales bacterium OttesenSCG-928-C03]MDL2312272.1 M23 family metallopeptidase [Bacteroidales bacterium OttesenSCG-928-B11]
MKKTTISHCYITIFAFFILVGLTNSCRQSSLQKEIVEEEVFQEDTRRFLFGICIDSLDLEEYKIKPGENLSVIFSSLGFNGVEIDRICRASANHLDPKKIIAGKPYFTLRTSDTLPLVHYIIFENTPTDFVIIDLAIPDSVRSYHFEKEIIRKQLFTEGVITSSLWNAIVSDGGDPMLALKLSDIYAWQIDFFDVKENDAFKVMYDVVYVDDTIPLYIDQINGAVFTHQGVDFHAIPFMQDSVMEYFDMEGNSLRKAFLKAPLDFYRITSRFSNSRMHPVLKKRRAHHGVDYAAPIGTPVKSIGDGVVVAKAYQGGGGGNYIKVKHNSTYTTTYMHLHKFAKGLAVGSHVKQGEVIGYVGSSGLSTGPHLDFRVHKNGQPIDPLKMESPPSLPVPEELREQYDSVKREVLKELGI